MVLILRDILKTEKFRADYGQRFPGDNERVPDHLFYSDNSQYSDEVVDVSSQLDNLAKQVGLK
ncbi:hypothetical protein GOV13_00620 [Candidatus Pacearchaeota archaeon]|nr:hypothetical protein [Candidatus Pacearchaeota archaeon]